MFICNLEIKLATDLTSLVLNIVSLIFNKTKGTAKTTAVKYVKVFDIIAFTHDNTILNKINGNAISIKQIDTKNLNIFYTPSNKLVRITLCCLGFATFLREFALSLFEISYSNNL